MPLVLLSAHLKRIKAYRENLIRFVLNALEIGTTARINYGDVAGQLQQNQTRAVFMNLPKFLAEINRCNDYIEMVSAWEQQEKDRQAGILYVTTTVEKYLKK